MCKKKKHVSFTPNGFSWAPTDVICVVSTCPGTVFRLAAPPPSASLPPLPPRPPLMERMRKIKRQLSLTLGRGGGAGGGDRTLNDTVNQDVTSHSDSGNAQMRGATKAAQSKLSLSAAVAST